MDIKENTLKSIKTMSILAIVISTILFAVVVYSRPLTLNGIDTSLKLQGYIDDKVYRLLEENNTNGVSIILFEEGEVSFINSYGHIEERQELIDEKTEFEIGRVSDSITAWAIMKLVQDGEINLDEPVRVYINNKETIDVAVIENRVTIRALLSDLDEGSTILQQVIEEVTGIAFESYVEDEIFKVLGMEDTSIEKVDDTNSDDNYQKEEGLKIKSTPKDIGIMLEETIKNENVIKRETMEQMSKMQHITNPARVLLSNAIGGYGLGYKIEPIFFSDSDICMYIGEEILEWQSIIAFDLENDSGIAILTNGGKGYKVCSEILDYYTDYQFNGTSFTSMYHIRIMKFWKKYVGVIMVSLCGIIYTRFKLKRKNN